jgi:hypothetical protein
LTKKRAADGVVRMGSKDIFAAETRSSLMDISYAWDGIIAALS